MKRYSIGIVGGSGFVGSNLAKYLSKKFFVRIIDITSKNLEHIEFMKCDVRNYSKLKSCLEDLDLVIHAAIIQIPMINEDKRLAYEVNFIGTHNVCRAVDELPRVKGMILAGSWHTIGEKEIRGVVNEEFGFRPDKVEDRAKLYALAKIAQEVIVRFYDKMSDKNFGIIRMGTLLGEDMPEKTAANIFITRGLKGESITPYKHSMYRPMFYLDIDDACKAYESYAKKILNNEIQKHNNSISHIFNVYHPQPLSIIQLARIIRDVIIKYTDRKIIPKIEVINKGLSTPYSENDVKKIKIDVSKAKKILGISSFLSPKRSIEKIIKNKIKNIHQ